MPCQSRSACRCGARRVMSRKRRWWPSKPARMPPAARRASTEWRSPTAVASLDAPSVIQELDASGDGQQAEAARGADDRLGARDEWDVDHPAIHEVRADALGLG